MKKLFLLLGIVLVCGTIFVYAESPTLTVQQEMKDLLDLILEKLNIIADKDTTVIVEPNITIQPEVNVYPDVNVTIPEKQCEWENFNFRVEFEQFYALNGGSISKYINIPPEVPLEEFNVLGVEADIYRYCTIWIYVNDILAGESAGNGNTRMDISPSSFNLGINKITLEVYTSQGGNCRGDMFLMDFETQIKPANC